MERRGREEGGKEDKETQLVFLMERRGRENGEKMEEIWIRREDW